MLLIALGIIISFILINKWRFDTIEKYQTLYGTVYSEVFDYALSEPDYVLLDNIIAYDKKYTEAIMNGKLLRVKNIVITFCEKYGQHSVTNQYKVRNEKINQILK